MLCDNFSTYLGFDAWESLVKQLVSEHSVVAHDARCEDHFENVDVFEGFEADWIVVGHNQLLLIF